MNKQKEKSSILHRVMTIIGIVLCVILIPILVANFTFIIKGTVNPEQVPTFFGQAPLIVLSGSMENDEMKPNIRTGDLIFVSSVNPDNLKTGDIIAFKDGSSVVSHRIIRLEEKDGQTVFITKGDNPINSEDQSPVSKENVVGIYRFKISGLGNFAMFLQTPVGMLCFIGIPLILFVLYDIIRRRCYLKTENNKNAELEAELERLRKLAGENQDSANQKAETHV